MRPNRKKSIMTPVLNQRETSMMEPAREEAARKGAAKETRKRPYAPPRLTVHGDVEELTKVLRLARSKQDFTTGPV